jgi:hypothetical protein
MTLETFEKCGDPHNHNKQMDFENWKQSSKSVNYNFINVNFYGW